MSKKCQKTTKFLFFWFCLWKFFTKVEISPVLSLMKTSKNKGKIIKNVWEIKNFVMKTSGKFEKENVVESGHIDIIIINKNEN